MRWRSARKTSGRASHPKRQGEACYSCLSWRFSQAKARSGFALCARVLVAGSGKRKAIDQRDNALFLAQVVVQPAQNLLPIFGIPVYSRRSTNETFFPNGHHRPTGRWLQAIGRRGLALSEERMSGESAGHQDLVGDVELTE